MTALLLIIGIPLFLFVVWCLFSDPDLDGWHPWDEDDDEK